MTCAKGPSVRDAVRRLRDHDEEGLSLVEIMVAAFILSVALLALASTATSSLIQLSVSLGRQEAMDAASAMIEDLRRTNYAVVALDASDPNVAALDPCDGEYSEPLVTSNLDGTIPHRQQFGPSGRITLITTVSWYDESGAGCDHGDRNVKRVRVQAEWVDRGRSFTLEESTLVAPIDRGLPAPDFRFGPPEHELEYHWSDVPDVRERCLPHALRNLGATDGYEWQIRRVGSTGPPTKSSESEYWLADGRWYIRAFLEFPLGDPALDPADEDVPHGQVNRHANMHDDLELLVDQTGNAWPETEMRLAAGDQARLWVCYRPGKSQGDYAPGESVAFEVTVRSQFDPNRFEMVEHKVTIVDQFLHLFLFDEYVPEPDHTPTTEEASHPRVRVTQGNTLGLPVLPMGPDVGTEPATLGATSGLPNYDTDFTALAGMRLKDGPRDGFTESDWPASRVRFHYQVTPTTTFRPTVNLRLFSLAEEVNAGTKTDARLDYQIRLEVLRKNENAFNPPQEVLNQTVSYVHNQRAWMQLDASFTMPGGDLTIDNDRYLRLDITCLNTSEDTCHIAFDHVDFPSYLRVQVRS
jgi:type II secretory pathway pseudopilin PulG